MRFFKLIALLSFLILSCRNQNSKETTYSEVFGQWLCYKAEMDNRLMAITPAMREGSGMVNFSNQFKDRFFDVAIAEQHAVTFAAGMACEGLKPVVAIYSTFLQRYVNIVVIIFLYLYT